MIKRRIIIRLGMMGGQSDPLGIGQEIEIWVVQKKKKSIWSYEQMVNVQARIVRGEWYAQIPQGFWDTKGSHNLGLTTRHSDSSKKGKKKEKREPAELWNLPFQQTTE